MGLPRRRFTSFRVMPPSIRTVPPLRPASSINRPPGTVTVATVDASPTTMEGCGGGGWLNWASAADT